MLQLIKSLRRRLLRFSAVLIIVAAGAWLSGWEPPFIAVFHEHIWDRFVELRPRPHDPALGVRIVDIDEKSLNTHGQWPWPRTRIARLIDALTGYGVRVVVFDVIFAEPDRSSLQQVFESLKTDLPGYTPPLSEEAIAQHPENDHVMAAAMGRVPVVLGLAVQKTRDDPQGQPRRLQNLPRVSYESRKDQRYLTRFADAVSAIPLLQKAAATSAGLDMVTDPDGITRRIPLLFKIGRRTVPALSTAAVLVAEGGSLEVRTRAPGVRAVVIGPREVPTDRYGRMRLYDSGSVRDRYIPATDVLTGSVSGDELADAIVIVGTGAEGLGDLRLTPLERWVPGMETHAQAIEQILSGQFLTRPEWGPRAEAGAVLLGGLLLLIATWWTWQRLPPWGFAVVFGVGFFAAAWFAFANHRMLLDPVLPAATLLAAAVIERLLLVLDLRRERSQVRNAFSRYVAPTLVEQLAVDPDRLKLGGETRVVTLLFCDVRGFTSISESFKQDPQGLTRLINQFLTPMTDVILARRGTIDKYMGDCIMAFWNAPIDDPDHAINACDSALEMFRELSALNGRLADEAEAEGRESKTLNMGIGLNTGECVVGNMGSEQRFDYSVLGDAANLASRLEGQSKTYGVGIVIGEATRAAVPGYAALELDLIAVKGKQEAVKIYALCGNTGTAASSGFQELARAQDDMLAAYRAQDWARARAGIDRCRSFDSDLQTFYDLYAARVSHYEKNPPGPNWDGVFVATTK